MSNKYGTIEPHKEKEEKCQQKKGRMDAEKQMLKDLKKAIQKQWKAAKCKRDKAAQKEARTQFHKVITALNRLRREAEKVEKDLVVAVLDREFKKDAWNFCYTHLGEFSSKGKSATGSPSLIRNMQMTSFRTPTKMQTGITSTPHLPTFQQHHLSQKLHSILTDQLLLTSRSYLTTNPTTPAQAGMLYHISSTKSAHHSSTI